MPFRILVINPGATSTKIAVFIGGEATFQESATHGAEDLKGFDSLLDQIPYRKRVISEALEKSGAGDAPFDAVVGRGGLLAPLPGGVYEVSPQLVEDAMSFRFGAHASNLGPILARDFAEMAGCGAFVVDPVTTDEWDPVARFSGLAGMDRVCRFHALNHRSVARRVASEMGRTYEESAFIVAHLGTGITVGAHVGGRVIDSCDAMCEGSFSVDRAGWLPTLSLIDMCYSGEFTRSEMLRRVNGGGGVFSYLGTTDMRAVEEMASSGDERALRVVEAMAYQTAKDIGAMAAVCRGRVDCVVLTGALARYKDLADMIASRVGFIAPVRIIPGEDEMESLASGALRVLEGTERAKTYPGVTAGA